jgi:hypothetical protein
MAVCYATAVGPKKGKKTWGGGIFQKNPLLRVGRPLKFPHPMHFCLRRVKERTIRTRPSTASPRNFFFLLSSPSPLSPAVDFFCARPSMAVGWCLQRRLRRKKKKKKFNALGSEERISGESTMGRQQWTIPGTRGRAL